MKKKLFLVCMSLVWTVALMAQQIAVVSESGTKVYRTLQEAIEGAPENSVIYLPNGSFPIADDVKITRKLTIIGVGHYIKNGNVDGITTINGSLFFNEGSSGSTVMGCYFTGNIKIEKNVFDVLIRFCNVNSIIDNIGGVINQNYVRDRIAGGAQNTVITNNIFYHGRWLGDCIIMNNIICDGLWDCKNSIIENNILIGGSFGECSGSIINNLQQLEDNWNNVFVNYNNGSISPVSDFHFKEAYKLYETQYGIYAGTGFSDAQLAPVPYIVRKIIPEHTDAEGKLNIKIRVKAGE